MKTGVPAVLLTALMTDTARPVVFVNCAFTTAIRRSTLDIDYYIDGSKYEAGGVKISGITSGMGLPVARMQIVMANADRALSTILLANNELGAEVTVYLAGIDDDGVLIGGAAVPVFRGELSYYEIEDDSAVLHIVNELIRWRRKTSRKSQASCPWPFKDAECQYAGAEAWCNQTHDRCSALANTDNFGGNRFLPDIKEKRLWWGRVQS